MQGFFITGTDTDIGKTYSACQLIKNLVQQGKQVSPRKPIASGCEVKASKLYCSDTHLLKQAAQTQDSLEAITPYSFQPAISPARAIKQAGLDISLENLVQACQVPQGSLAIVEGAGGFLSPLTPSSLNADLAQALNLPIILVVGNKLGCLNHALLTIEAIEKRNLKIHQIILNDINLTSDPDNFDDLKHLTPLPVIHQKYSRN